MVSCIWQQYLLINSKQPQHKLGCQLVRSKTSQQFVSQLLKDTTLSNPFYQYLNPQLPINSRSILYNMKRAITLCASRLTKIPIYRFSTFKPHYIPSNSTTSRNSLALWRPLKYNFSSSNQQSITMPALSPTMNTGKIVKWSKKVGDKVNAGDLLCEVETDKATVDFETNSEGYLAKIIKKEGESADVGEQVAIIVENEADIGNISSSGDKKQSKKSKKQEKKQEKKQDKKPQKEQDKNNKQASKKQNKKSSKNKKQDKEEKEQQPEEQEQQQVEDKKQNQPKQKKQSSQQNKNKQSKKQEQKEQPEEDQEEEEEQSEQQTQKNKKPQKSKQSQEQQSAERIIASPLAKNIAEQKNINLQGVKGSGPGGRIIQQDVQDLVQKAEKERSMKQQPTDKEKDQKQQEQPSKKSGKFVAPENPFEEIPLTGMRKTIAARLLQSKTTIPHYYISVDIQMDSLERLRADINNNQVQNGVKISVNDFILKAAGLALRDFPTVNVQWGEKSIKQFKYCDVSMAVSTESGLITPIIYRAQTKGLVQIAKQSKQLAKKARQNKLQPSQFVGGTISVSNAGMYGLNQMVSVINPPQAIILGVAKAEKKVLYDQKAEDVTKPFKVASVMTVWASVDHRLVDGALAAQYLGRVKKYLQNPVNMIL